MVIFQVARRPIHTILACVALTLLSCIGFLNFNPLTDKVKLWIPEGSVSAFILKACLSILLPAF